MSLKNDASVSYKDTLNLPHTDFPIRPNAAVDDPAMIVRWETTNLYDDAFVCHQGNEKFVLHVGPPYANGHIHLGHAYNFTLKDFVTKAYRMAGYHVPVKPGWDCHGLPIEIKVTEANPGLSRLELTRACRSYAQHWIDVQRSEFKRLGILMKWDDPYETMSPSYESATIRAFGILLEQGFIERNNKTVTWCPSCQTVLATAEIEYRERKDPSIYVRLVMDPVAVKKLFPEVSEPVSFLIWTTTPWTLPLNRGIMLHPHAEYVLARINNHLIVIGKQALTALERMLQTTAKIIKTVPSSTFDGAKALHPFEQGLMVPIVFDESVGLDEGTACVHTAPGCGPSDYEVGVRNKLEIYSPITPDGRYDVGIKPTDLEGFTIADAQGEIIKRLDAGGALFHKTSIKHSYPHCWRCHKGLIFRATKQWFFNLEHENVQQHALKAIEDIAFLPPQGRNFLRATVENRWEWCISRQRVWGTPIPALLCEKCDYVYCTPELVNGVAERVSHEGIEYWQRVEVSDLFDAIPDCAGCGTAKWRKEYDILDVWFDSGVSHYAVLYDNPALHFPASMYLEGIDQHRGWFQSSLLTAMVIEKKAPMKSIMTHGFTVDEKGQKMSKSVGNVVAPQEIIDKLGTDGLRLWVASLGNEGDAVVSPALIQNVGEVFRKIRNTARFLLANIYDYGYAKDAVPLNQLYLIDRAILVYLADLNKELINDYKDGDFTAVFHGLADFCTTYLSSWYLDIIKDRLYVEKATGHSRRAAQTTCYQLLDTLTKLMAPVLSFTAEQLSDLYQKDKKQSIHLQQFNEMPNLWAVIAKEQGAPDATAVDEYMAYQYKAWDALDHLRDRILKAIEEKRGSGQIKHSLEAAVHVTISNQLPHYELLKQFFAELKDNGESVSDFLAAFVIASKVTLTDKGDHAALVTPTEQGIAIEVTRAKGVKCPRCWHWQDSTHPNGLCNRCAELVNNTA